MRGLTPDHEPKAPPTPIAEIAGYLIRRSQQIHNAYWLEEFGADVTSPQYAVLTVLARWSGIDQRRLGELASLDRSTVADIVSRLVRKNWLERVRDASDGRRNVLDLAPDAMQAFAHLTPSARRVQDRLLAPLDQGERPAFTDALRRVARIDFPIALDDDPSGLALDLGAPGHLIRCAQQVHTAMWAEEFDRELTGPQYATMYVVAQSSALDQRTVAELAALDTSTATDILGRLTRRGWIERSIDPEDRRRNLMSLSDTAHQRVRDLVPRVMGVQERRFLTRLAPSERSSFVDRLARVAYAGPHTM